MNKWNLKFKIITIYISTPKTEVLRYKPNKICTRAIRKTTKTVKIQTKKRSKN